MAITINGNVIVLGNVNNKIKGPRRNPARRVRNPAHRVGNPAHGVGYQAHRVGNERRRVIDDPELPAPALLNVPQQQHRARAVLPSLLDDPIFWFKINTLPEQLHRHINLQAPGTTCAILRRLIWHFNPGHVIPCRMLKAELIDQFEVHVAQRYGAYYGI